MSSISEASKRIAVIGGGITGVAAAHRLREISPEADVTLFEGTDRLGGVIRTVRRDGFLLEQSADNFITYVPWGVGLCRRIGFEDQLVRTDDRHRKAFVVYRGRLVDIPEGFLLMAPSKAWPILLSPLLSLRGKMRLGMEFFVPQRRETTDESMASFVRRRLGPETYDRIVQPLVGGIYTGDPEKLSIGATMPQFVEMERKWGGLIRGTRGRMVEAKKKKRESQQSDNSSSEKEKSGGDNKSSGARYSMFVTPRNGLQSMIDAVAQTLVPGAVRLEHRVSGLQRLDNGQWEVFIDGRDGSEKFDGVILAMPAHCSAQLVRPIDTALAGDLDGIPYTGTTVVSFAYRREQVSNPLKGFGFVVPKLENRRIIAGSFSSVKYPGRAPEGTVLMRVFIGGAVQESLGMLPDEDLKQLVREEMGELVGASGEPIFWEISRWQGTMAQYNVGHVELVKDIEERAAEIPGLELAGNAFHGVGMPQCIHSGEQAAERIVGYND